MSVSAQAVQHGELPGRVLVADDEHLVAVNVATNLTGLGIEVIGPASTGVEAVRLAEQSGADMALLDIRMPEMDGLETAGIIYHRLGIPVMIISAFSEDEYISTGARIGVFGYLLKPVTCEELRAAVTVAWSRYRQHNRLKSEVDELKSALENRKLVERAKGILMDRLTLSEGDAMKRMQKQARDTRRKLHDVARSILENEQLFRGEQ